MSIADLRLVDGPTVRRMLQFPDLIEALRQAHLGPAADVRRIVYGPDGQDDRLMCLPAWTPGVGIGTKLVTVFGDNPARDLPSVQALYVLFDVVDGRPLCVMDGTELTYWKTAADSGLGAFYLAPKDASTLVMVGAGSLAPYLIEAHCSVRPSIQRVLVWNRTASRARDLADRVGGQAVTDLPRAIRSADVVVTATMSADPVVLGEWLTPGTHLDLVGAYKPDTREVDDEVVRRSQVYVDSWLAAVEECGDLVIPLRSGVLRHSDIRGDLFDLTGGRTEGRTDPDVITLFENGGGGHLDLMAAQHLWSRLQE